jgi:cell division protein FtsZ
MEGAHGVLLSISGGSDLGIFEINEAASMVADSAHVEANIIFGAIIDDALGDEVRVTVIAAGFDGGAPKHKPVEAQRRDPAPERIPGGPVPPIGSTMPTVTSRYGPPATAGARGGSAGSGVNGGGHVRRTVELDDELDVPDFLKG